MCFHTVGVWSLTAAYLAQQLRPSVQSHVVIVEPDFDKAGYVDAMEAQFLVNNVKAEIIKEGIVLDSPDKGSLTIHKLLEPYRTAEINLLYFSPQHDSGLTHIPESIITLTNKVCTIVVDLYYEECGYPIWTALTKVGWRMGGFPNGGSGNCDRINSGQGSSVGPIWNMHYSILVFENVGNEHCKAKSLCTDSDSNWISDFAWPQNLTESEFLQYMKGGTTSSCHPENVVSEEDEIENCYNKAEYKDQTQSEGEAIERYVADIDLQTQAAFLENV